MSGRYLTRTSDLHDVNVEDELIKGLENKPAAGPTAVVHTKLRIGSSEPIVHSTDTRLIELIRLWDCIADPSRALILEFARLLADRHESPAQPTPVIDDNSSET